MSRRVRWNLVRNGELVSSGVRFKAREDIDAILARARRDAAGQARSGDQLTVFLDGAVLHEEQVVR